MNKLYEKLNKEIEHVQLTSAEKSAMRARIFGAPAPSPVRITTSQYVFLSQKWMVAFASFVIVVFAGSSTVFAAQGSLPGQPLYAVKTNVIEPMRVALASTPAEKAAVHVDIAQTRVEEAEALTQKGQLTESASLALAQNFEDNAAKADSIASTVAAENPVAAAEITTKLEASSAAGSAVLVALADRGSEKQKASAHSLAARILARANISRADSRSDEGEGANSDSRGGARSAVTLAIAPQSSSEPTSSPQPKAMVSTFAAVTATSASTSENEPSIATAPTDAARGTSPNAELRVETVSMNARQISTANQLKEKAKIALDAARAQFLAASSTLDASTTVAIESSLSNIGRMLEDGSQAADDTLFDTAVRDFTEALSASLKVQALIKAEKSFDLHTILPWLDFQRGDN